MSKKNYSSYSDDELIDALTKKSKGYKIAPKVKVKRYKRMPDKRFPKGSSSDEARMKFREKELEELKKRRKKFNADAFIEYSSEQLGSSIRKKK